MIGSADPPDGVTWHDRVTTPAVVLFAVAALIVSVDPAGTVYAPPDALVVSVCSRILMGLRVAIGHP